MLSAIIANSIIAVIAASTMASAAPHGIEELHKSHEGNRTECRMAPVVQIHPANRTDLCLGLTSTIPARGNSSLGLSDCNVQQPNNETRFYGFWDRIDSGVQGAEFLRLVNTQLCLEDSIPTSPAKVQDCSSLPSQYFSYVRDTKQILVSNSTWCLGIGRYNAPEIQQCLPTGEGQAWVFN